MKKCRITFLFLKTFFRRFLAHFIIYRKNKKGELWKIFRFFQVSRQAEQEQGCDQHLKELIKEEAQSRPKVPGTIFTLPSRELKMVD
jgi:hypothetical protein